MLHARRLFALALEMRSGYRWHLVLRGIEPLALASGPLDLTFSVSPDGANDRKTCSTRSPPVASAARVTCPPCCPAGPRHQAGGSSSGQGGLWARSKPAVTRKVGRVTERTSQGCGGGADRFERVSPSPQPRSCGTGWAHMAAWRGPPALTAHATPLNRTPPGAQDAPPAAPCAVRPSSRNLTRGRRAGEHELPRSPQSRKGRHLHAACHSLSVKATSSPPRTGSRR